MQSALTVLDSTVFKLSFLVQRQFQKKTAPACFRQAGSRCIAGQENAFWCSKNATLFFAPISCNAFRRTVPRQPIDEREVAICKRARLARAETKLSRVAFAAALGVDSGAVSRIEHLRAPLRMGLARRMALKFGISLAWLVEGSQPMRDDRGQDLAAIDKSPESQLLSRHYDLHLREIFSQRRSDIESIMSQLGQLAAEAVTARISSSRLANYYVGGGGLPTTRTTVGVSWGNPRHHNRFLGPSPNGRP